MINWAKKPPIKKEKKEIRRAREKDRNKFAKKKNCVNLITSDQPENMAFFLQNSFLGTLMLISRKPVQRRGIGEK